MEKSFWLSKVVYNTTEKCFDVIGASVVYSKGQVGSVVDNVSCERANTANDPAIVFIYSNPDIFPLLVTAGLKRLPDFDTLKNSNLLNTTKLKRIATAIKTLDYGKYIS